MAITSITFDYLYNICLYLNALGNRSQIKLYFCIFTILQPISAQFNLLNVVCVNKIVQFTK